jgi:hypothetical protein
VENDSSSDDAPVQPTANPSEPEGGKERPATAENLAVTPDSWGRASTFVLAHTILAALFLGALRLHKLQLRDVDLSGLQTLEALGGDWGLLLLLQIPWLLTVRTSWAGRFTSWPLLYLAFHVPLYALAATGHRYFYETGVVQNGEMVLYMLRELSGSAEVLSAGLDSVFVTLVGAVFSILGLMALVAWKRPSPTLTAHIGVPAGLLILGLSLLFLPRPLPAGARLFGGNWLTDLLPHPQRAAYLEQDVLDWLHYAPPQVDSGEWSRAWTRRSGNKPPPHILLVLLESTRRDMFSAYGGDASMSPRLNEFVKSATVVDNAYVALSHTTKSLVAIHCGMFPTLTISLPETKPGGVRMRCLPHILRSLGYQARFFQSAGNFEHRGQLLSNLGYREAFVPTKDVVKNAKRRGYLGWDEEILVEPLLNHLRTRSGPTLTTLLTLSTHHPYMATTGLPRAPKKVEASYRAAALRVDEVIGAALQKARHEGLLDNTLLIITGDHGEAFGHRVGFRQHDLVPYEDVTKIPLFIEGAGVPPGRISGLRHHIDLLPTILDLLAVPQSGPLPGHSLLAARGHPFVVSSCWYETMCMSLRAGEVSYSFFYGVSPMQAHNVIKDPDQALDIIDTIDADRRELVIKTMLGTRYGSLKHFMTHPELAP